MIKRFFLILCTLFISTNVSAIIASWNANPDDEEVISYTLYYRKEFDIFEKSVTTKTNGVSVNDKDFEVGATFIFTVSATNSYGEGPRSSEVKYTFEEENLEEDLPETPHGIKILKEKPPLLE